MNTQILKDKIKNDKILNNLASFFPYYKIYLVGGSVRDFLTGKISCDRDLVVEGVDARNFSLECAGLFGGKFIPLDETNKIYRVVLPDRKNYLDITNPSGGCIESDLQRRDITINAAAVDIKTYEIFDTTGGIKDLETRILRGIKEENFIDDPLRLLRIFRFYSMLGFELSEELVETVKKYSEFVMQPARERIIYELMKLFSGDYADIALLKMDECKILDKIFPFVKELKQVPPNSHHHLDLFHHSIETVRQIEIIYKNSLPEVQQHMERVDFGGVSRISHLKLACFMHDIGKFSTWTIEPNTDRHRFIKHEDAGAKLAETYLKSMKFSNKQISYISYIIKKHMYPTAVVSSPELSEKIMMRYVRKSEDNAVDNILIAQADRLSARGKDITNEIVEENITLLNRLLKFCLQSYKSAKLLPKLLNGNEVMKILKIKASPKLGEILDALLDAQISGEVVTKDDAMNFVKNYSAGCNLK